MEEIHRDLPARSFTRPQGIVTASVCLDSGHLPTEYCSADPRGNRTRSEVFAAGQVPAQVCRVHQQHTICTESDLLAGTSCPYWAVQTRVGLVRSIPIDDITASVSDRHLEFSLGVRQGLSCTHCFGGDFQQEYQESEFIWNSDMGQWIVNPNFNRGGREPETNHNIDETPPVNLDLLPPGGSPFAGDSPQSTPTPIPTSAPWPGLGGGAGENQPAQTPTPFVNTVTIPGLN